MWNSKTNQCGVAETEGWRMYSPSKEILKITSFKMWWWNKVKVYCLLYISSMWWTSWTCRISLCCSRESLSGTVKSLPTSPHLLLVTRLCLTLCNPRDCRPPGSSVYGNSSGKNTRVGCHSLFQGIFLTQGSNSGLPHYKQILYHLSLHGNPGDSS